MIWLMGNVPEIARPEPDHPLGPIEESERIVLLDVLRGFALYGVLVANTIPWHSGRAFLPQAEVAAHTSPFDVAALALLHMFIGGKSMTLFSFLFGLGFAVQLSRSAAKGKDGLALHARRLGFLFLIGIVHVILITANDILTSYAVIGLALLPFRRSSSRVLLSSAAVLLLVPPILFALPPVQALVGRVLPIGPLSDAFKAQLIAAYSGHDYVHLMRTHLRHHFDHVAHVGLPTLPWVLGRFLLGYLVGRSGLLNDPARYLPSMRKLLGWGLGLGLPLGIVGFVVPQLVGGDPPWALYLVVEFGREVGTMALASAYLAGIALLMQRPTWQRRLLPLAPIGQTALSNYIFQSLLCTFVFYGWGLGLIGRVGPALCIPITLAIFGVTIPTSRVWLRHFRFGPAEWLWRSLTYGKAQSMRRK